MLELNLNLYPFFSYHSHYSASLECATRFSATKNSHSTIRAHLGSGCHQLAPLQQAWSCIHCEFCWPPLWGSAKDPSPVCVGGILPVSLCAIRKQGKRSKEVSNSWNAQLSSSHVSAWQRRDSCNPSCPNFSPGPVNKDHVKSRLRNKTTPTSWVRTPA